MEFDEIVKNQEAWKKEVNRLIPLLEPKHVWRYQDPRNIARLWRIIRVGTSKVFLWLEFHGIIFDDESKWCILSDEIPNLTLDGKFTDDEMLIIQKLSEKLELALLKSIEDRERDLKLAKGLDPDAIYHSTKISLLVVGLNPPPPHQRT